jgi:hypothetical protein
MHSKGDSAAKTVPADRDAPLKPHLRRARAYGPILVKSTTETMRIGRAKARADDSPLAAPAEAFRFNMELLGQVAGPLFTGYNNNMRRAAFNGDLLFGRES